jgi:NhaP-type Na+/H+ or K+/H+ antiporter
VFSSLFSATDPVSVLSTFKEIKVDSKLYSLVFGESILNDAISLIFFRTLLELPATRFEFPGSAINVVLHFLSLLVLSCLLGIIIGLLGSYLLKKMYEKDDSINNYSHGISVMLILPWMSFLLADVIFI